MKMVYMRIMYRNSTLKRKKNQGKIFIRYIIIILTDINRQREFRERKRKRVEQALKKRIYRMRRKEIIQNLVSNPPSNVENISSVVDYKTPQKYKKQIRQRTHDLSKSLPRSPGLQTAVIGRMIKKYLSSPRTRITIGNVLQHYAPVSREVKPSRPNRKIQSIVFQIHKFRIKKDKKRLKECLLEMLKHCSIRDAAKRLQIHYTTLQRWMTFKESTSVRKVSDLNVENVRKFFTNSRISLQLPYKRYAKYYYLRSPLAVAYEEYVREQTKLNCRVLSKSAVYKCLKGVFRVRKKIPFKECLCDICVNNRLLIDALIAGGVKYVRRSLTENITLSFCPIATNNDSATRRKLNLDGSETTPTLITEHKRECIYRECQRCGAVHFQQALMKANENINWSKIVIWHQWEQFDLDEEENSEKEKKTKKRWDKFRYSGTLARLLSLFTVSLDKLSVHIFDFRWQAFQFDECKKVLRPGDVLFIIDFAMNHTHRRQDEIQSGFYSRKQTTMHPFVIYYVCEKCGDLIKDEVMIFSEDLKHDWNAVNTFFEKVLAHLDKRNVLLNRMIVYSDNAGSQYKNIKVFDTVSRRGIAVMHNYFGAKHGKAEADGAIGRLSQTIETVVRSGQYELGNSTELTKYCQKFLTLGDDTPPEICCHYRRHYYLVNDIKREENNDLARVVGTQRLHSVRNTGYPGIVEVRESSCFCETCFENAPGECKNKRLVKDFRWAHTCKSAKTNRTTVQNSQWHTTSQKYVCVRPKKKAVQRKTTGKYRNARVKNSAKNMINKTKRTQAANISKKRVAGKIVLRKVKGDRNIAVNSTNVVENENNDRGTSPPALECIDNPTENGNLPIVNVGEDGDTPVPALVVKTAAKVVENENNDRGTSPPALECIDNPTENGNLPIVNVGEDGDTPVPALVVKTAAKVVENENNDRGTSPPALEFIDNPTENGNLPIVNVGEDGDTPVPALVVKTAAKVVENENNDRGTSPPALEFIDNPTENGNLPIVNVGEDGDTPVPALVVKTAETIDSDSGSDNMPLSELVTKKPLISDHHPLVINLVQENSDSEDYESNMTLTDMKLYHTIPERSPVTLRVRERVEKVKSETRGGMLFDLDDYENPRTKGSGHNKHRKRGGKKVTEELTISGIDSLSHSILNSSNVSKSASQHCSVTNRGANTFSTPKRAKIPNISNMSLSRLSPILHAASSSVMPNDLPLSPDVQVTNKCVKKKAKNVYFKRTWMELQKTFLSCITFKQLRKKIEEEESKLPPLPPLFGDYSVAHDEVDTQSRGYIPVDTPRKFRSNDYIPVTVETDGNCFFRSLSRLVYGDEQYHLELRCRIVIDCVKNIDNYTSAHYLMRGAQNSKHGRVDILTVYCMYSGICKLDNREFKHRGIVDIFKEDTLRIRRDKEYADIWHFHSAANVLNRKIVMIFPKDQARDNLRVDMHRAFLPNAPNLNNEFCLMWTSLTDKRRVYNHIVPIVKRYLKNFDY